MKRLYRNERLDIRMYNNSYVVMDKSKGIYISYGIKRYSDKLAYKMAEYSAVSHRRIGNYFKIRGNVAILYINDNTNGIVKFKIDLEDLDKVLDYSWYLNATDMDEAYVVTIKNNKRIKLHRFILGLKKGVGIVDHKDNNKRNNMKSNLRLADSKINNRNFKLSKKNKVGCKGVHIDSKGIVCATIYRDSYKQQTKKFSINKYGYDEAVAMAIAWRKAKEKEYMYNTHIRKVFKK